MILVSFYKLYCTYNFCQWINTMKRLILCSQSPRRIQIFKDLNLKFDLATPNVDETQLNLEETLLYLKRISKSKVYNIAQNIQSPESTLISSDTIVTYENSILHKPTNFKNAVEILSTLSGKIHYVHSSFYILIISGQIEVFDYVTTKVYFKPWKLGDIEKYILDYQPFDKAGSYGIQDSNGPVDKFEGSYTNVMGFPIRKFFKEYPLWKYFIE